jgi:membrane protein YdbS with pleckstrin-like domain
MTSFDPNAPLPNTAAAQPQSPEQGAPHRAPDDQEEVYYEGSPLLRGALGKGFLWIFCGVILIAAAIAGLVFRMQDQTHTWAEHIPWWAFLVVAFIGLCLILVPLIQSKTVRYRVSNYRIDYERGLLSKDIDTLELWHVEDIRFHQSLIDRLLGVGNITVVSHDETMPMLVMHDVPHARELFEQLKQRIIAVKRSRGVIKMDPG